MELYCKSVATSQADAIKFQIFSADELALKDYKYYGLFKNLELPIEVWKKAVDSIHDSGKQFFSDIFGEQSLKELHSIGVDGFKIHSTDVDNLQMLKAVAQTKKQVLLSTGGTESTVIDVALDILSQNKVTLMHGFQAEPTEIADNNLNRIKTIKEKYGLPVGFQDHTAGDHPLAQSLPLMAIGLGATLIEKHLTLSRGAEVEDFVSALTVEEFGPWVENTKLACEALGNSEWELTAKEKQYKAAVRRAICARHPVDVGQTIQREDLVLKRSGHDQALYSLDDVVGKTLAAPIVKDQPLTSGLLK